MPTPRTKTYDKTCRHCGADCCIACGKALAGDGECYTTGCPDERVACSWCGNRGTCAELELDHHEKCADCRERHRLGSLARERCEEIMRRLQAWARYEGTRQRIAQHLATELRTRFGKHCRMKREQWCLMWDASGDLKALRKIVTKLQPEWKRDGVTVKNPPEMAEPNQRANNIEL